MKPGECKGGSLFSTENEIDSSLFPDLTDADFYQMFGNKIGIARRLMILKEVSV